MSLFQEFMAYMSVGFWILPAYIVAMIIYHALKPAGFDWQTTPIFKDDKYFKTSPWDLDKSKKDAEKNKTPDFGQVTRDAWGRIILKTDEVPKTKDGETIH